MDKEHFWTMVLAMCGAQLADKVGQIEPLTLASRAARMADALTAKYEEKRLTWHDDHVTTQHPKRP